MYTIILSWLLNEENLPFNLKKYTNCLPLSPNPGCRPRKKNKDTSGWYLDQSYKRGSSESFAMRHAVSTGRPTLRSMVGLVVHSSVNIN